MLRLFGIKSFLDFASENKLKPRKLWNPNRGMTIIGMKSYSKHSIE